MYVKSIDGSSVYYEKTGFGPSILLIHGLGGDHNIWHETGWVDNLKNDFTVIICDLRGCGKSEISDKPDFYSINNHLSDILAIIKQEKVINPIIFGWSLGGTIATHFASKYKIRKAIISGTYFGLIFSDEFVKNGIKATDDLILKRRIKDFYTWPIITPDQMKCPFMVYSGTNDGNVVRNLNLQKDSIISHNGKLVIFNEIDHFGLIRNKDQVIPSILSFIKD